MRLLTLLSGNDEADKLLAAIEIVAAQVLALAAYRKIDLTDRTQISGLVFEVAGPALHCMMSREAFGVVGPKGMNDLAIDRVASLVGIDVTV